MKVNAVRDSYGAEIRFCECNQAARESTCDEVMREYKDSCELIRSWCCMSEL